MKKMSIIIIRGNLKKDESLKRILGTLRRKLSKIGEEIPSRRSIMVIYDIFMLVGLTGMGKYVTRKIFLKDRIYGCGF